MPKTKLAASDWKLEYCPKCDYPVTLTKGETLDQHIQKNHPKTEEYDPEGHDWTAIEEDPAGLESRSPTAVSKSDDDFYFSILQEFEIHYPDLKYEKSVDDILEKILPRLKGKPLNLAVAELYNEYLDFALTGLQSEEKAEEELGSEEEDFFRTCPKCAGDMEFWDGSEISEKFPDYWYCIKCGHYTEVEKQKTWTYQSILPFAEIDHKIDEYKSRKDLQYDKITDQVFLGDIVNGWIMRDRGIAPFDAILNVSQHEYTPPNGVEYVHVPIEEYKYSDEDRAERKRSLRKAIDQLKKWVAEGKKVYVHCTAGMNRSPTVVTGFLMESQGLDYDTAFDAVVEARDAAWPSGEMDFALRELEGVPPQQRKETLYEKGQPVSYTSTTDAVKKFLEKYSPKKIKQMLPRWYSGEKEILQTHPKYPPPGGVHKIKKPKEGLSTQGSFQKTAIYRSDLNEFYLLMQLPPEFFADVPKWNAYAEEVINKIADEYAKQLETLVRNEAHSTKNQIGVSTRREEEECEHEFNFVDNEYHQCSLCGELLTHDWESDDELSHHCTWCMEADNHSFDADHYCGLCSSQYSHTWIVSDAQEYTCSGCESIVNELEEDADAPFYGDFDEQNHAHQWTQLDDDQIMSWGNAAKCFQCGRVIVWNTAAGPQLEPTQEELFKPDYGFAPLTYEEILRKKLKKQEDLYQQLKIEQKEKEKAIKQKYPHLFQPESPVASVLRELRKFAQGEHEKFMLGPGVQSGVRFPGLEMDTGRWFGNLKVYPEGQKQWMPYSEYKKLFGPKETRLYDQMLIENPWAAATEIDPEAVKWFEYARNMKWMLKTLRGEDLRRMVRYIRMLSNKPIDLPELEFGVVQNFVGATGIGQLYKLKEPTAYARLAWEEISGEVANAWDTYTDELADHDAERGEFYQNLEAPSPDWISDVEIDLEPIGSGTAIGQKSASGPAAFTAEQAAQYPGFILVKTETTPEDLKLMTDANGFLMASGGPTSHAAIVARQMGKACIVSGNFIVSDTGAQFANGAVISPGDHITISSDGKIYGGTSQKVQQVEPDKEEAIEELSDEEKTYREIVQLEDHYLGGPARNVDLGYVNHRNDPLDSLAKAFRKSLHVGAYGGPLWALAAVRAIQLQQAIEDQLPWKYRGMLVDQVNTLQHNTGNIFHGKDWPGTPQRFIDDVLDMKASTHGLQWLSDYFSSGEVRLEKGLEKGGEKEGKIQALLSDFNKWLAYKKISKDSFFGPDISQLSENERERLKSDEMSDVRERRTREQKELYRKWEKKSIFDSPIVVWGENGDYTAVHTATFSSCSIFHKDGEWQIHHLYIPDTLKKKGLLRRFFDVLAEAAQ